MSFGKSRNHEPSAYDRIPVNRATFDLHPRIIIVSDARLYREGLALSLARVDRVVVVGVADTVASALTCIEDNNPDVVLGPNPTAAPTYRLAQPRKPTDSR